MKLLYIYGASGHAKVVIDAAEKMGCYKIEGLIDDNILLRGKTLVGYPILGDKEYLRKLNTKDIVFFVAIGINQTRQRISLSLLSSGFELCTIIHPSAIIAKDTFIDIGTVLMAGTVLNTSSKIGRFCIINSSSSIDHDCIIGEAVHICPGVKLAGDVHIGDMSWIGINSCVIEGKRIGRDCTVGAGACVTKDIDSGLTVVGIPAKPLFKS